MEFANASQFFRYLSLMYVRFLQYLYLSLTDSEAGSKGVLFHVEGFGDSFKPNSHAAPSHGFGIFLGLRKVFQVPLILLSH